MTGPGQTTPTSPRPPQGPRAVPSYYNNLQLPGLTRRVQDVESLKGTESKKSARTQSFLLDFGKDEAWVWFSPKKDEVHELLRAKRPDTLCTRWINIWKPFESKDIIDDIGQYYGFTPRLRALMASEPNKPSYAVQMGAGGHRGHVGTLDRLKRSFDRSSRTSVDQVEMKETHMEGISLLDLSHYKIADEIWHYHSVDFGPKYVCIGYNAIHHTKAEASEDLGSVNIGKTGRIVPQGRRLWCWLILCHDDTVISIHEDPGHRTGAVQFEDEDTSSANQEVSYSHFVDVFNQLANPERDIRTQNPITILPIRVGRNADPKMLKSWPSMLFYYLFDDWYTAYSLASRGKEAYGSRLDRLRSRMLQKADLMHIETLHRVGRQLSTLKKVYESYTLLIDRLLKRQMHPQKTEVNSGGVGTIIGPILSPEAFIRFENMKNRIKLYAQGEIEECSSEKEALVFMTFNLLAHKESQAVERLTRTTIFLAKVTILFLPVTLMTGYFSVQIQDLQGVYSATTYWACFAIVMGLSLLSILIFGLLTGTVEGGMMYQSFTRIGLDKFLGSRTRRKEKHHKA